MQCLQCALLCVSWCSSVLIYIRYRSLVASRKCISIAVGCAFGCGWFDVLHEAWKTSGKQNKKNLYTYELHTRTLRIYNFACASQNNKSISIRERWQSRNMDIAARQAHYRNNIRDALENTKTERPKPFGGYTQTRIRSEIKNKNKMGEWKLPKQHHRLNERVDADHQSICK